MIFELLKYESKEEKEKKAKSEEALKRLVENLEEAAEEVKKISQRGEYENLLLYLKNKNQAENIYLISRLIENLSLKNPQEACDQVIEPPEYHKVPDLSQQLSQELLKLSPPVFAIQERVVVSCQEFSGFEPSAQAKSLSVVEGYLIELLERAGGKVDKEVYRQIENAYWRVKGLKEDLRIPDENIYANAA